MPAYAGTGSSPYAPLPPWLRNATMRPVPGGPAGVSAASPPPYRPPVGSNQPGGDGSTPPGSGDGGGPINSPIPGAAQYGALMAEANRAYMDALSTLNQQRSSLLQQYGYQGNVDAKTGAITGLHVNPTDPYGLYQSMMRQDAGLLDQAQADAAGRGLHGGLAHQLLTQAHFQHGANSATFGQNLSNAIYALQAQQNQALAARNSAILQAQLQAATAAISAGAFTPAPISNTPVVPKLPFIS